MTIERNNDTKVAAPHVDKVAIIGVACRLPGGIASLEDYWQVLSLGKDVVTQVSAERFGVDFYQHPNRKEAGRSVTFSAGVLDHIDQFDTAFFGISPREAAQMDPQQRLLLELTWEAIENSSLRPEQLAGSDCAVYVGIASNDYMQRRVDDPASIDAYTMTGNTASIAANRISYLFDLQGPSVAVDTACSSSLVAVHQACQAIRSGEASMAIAGGVNMLLHPFAFVGFSQASMLSARGRCRTFDESGDGYVRSEGAAVLVLKPLRQAEADGDYIYGVIAASGINADGKTNGMTVPSDRQQAQLLRKVYREAQLDPNELVYLEAHGTGTAIGDPIETRAIGEALGQARREPLLIGSAKTNVGHLETASGMAGLLKGLLALRHQAVPATIHIQQLNTRIDFAHLNLQVVTQLTPLASQDRQLIGVNSFGFGGANAHVVLERYKPTKPTESAPQLSAPTLDPPLVFSAHSPAALHTLVASYVDLLTARSVSSYDLAWNLAVRRTHLPYGLVVRGAADPASLKQHLVEYLAHTATSHYLEGHRTGETGTDANEVALVFSGNGSQWQGMGQVLLAEQPVFRAAVEQVNALFQPLAGYSLLEELLAAESDSKLDATEIAQPLLFAYQVGLVHLLRQYGIKIAYTLGHSVGEVAAAWAADLLSLEQAVRVIYYRSQAQGKTRGQGRMAAVGLGEATLLERLQALGLNDTIEIAGFNSPTALTLSGQLADLATLQLALEQEGVFFRLLDLDYAFHSRWMEPVRAELLAHLQDLAPSLPAQVEAIRFISTVEGKVLTANQLDAEYWWRNIREPVAFAPALQTAAELGARIFIEVGPHFILRGYINDSLKAFNVAGASLVTGKRRDEQPQLAEVAAWRTWLAGGELNWQAYFPHKGSFITLPNYPWQRELCWHPITVEGYNIVKRQKVHPLLGYRLKEVEWGWENHLDTQQLPWLADHVVDGAVVVPAAAYVEIALAAAQQWQSFETYALEQLEIQAPIVLDGQQSKTLRFVIDPSDGSFILSSRERLSNDAWTVNVVGRLTGPVFKTPPSWPPVTAWQCQAKTSFSHAEHYHLTQQVGLEYLAAFQAVQTVWVKADEALAELALPNAIAAEFASYSLHPALLDAGFQVLVDIFYQSIQAGQRNALIPLQVGQLNYYRYAQPAWVYVTVRKKSPRSVVADFAVLAADGQPIVELTACRFRSVQFAQQRIALPSCYAFLPVPKPLTDTGLAIEQRLDLVTLQAALQQSWQQQSLAHNREKHYLQTAPLLDALASAYVWETAQVLANAERSLTCSDVAVAQQPFLQHVMQWLVEDGLAFKHSATHWQLAETSDLPPAQAIWLSILGETPAYVPELVRLGRVGSHLAAILRGEIEANALLKADKSSIYEHWLDTSPSFQILNTVLAHTIEAFITQWPLHQSLRVLQIGGARTGLAHHLASFLPLGRSDYVVVEYDEAALSHLAELIESHPTIKSFLIEPDWRCNSFDGLTQIAPFDLIVVGDALWPWAELAPALARLNSLLRPEGVMLLAQAQANRALDLTEGTNPAWWLSVTQPDHATTDPTVLSRLHTANEWSTALEQTGFSVLPAVFDPASFESDSFIVVAQSVKAASVPTLEPHELPLQTWLILADATGYSAQLAQALQHGLLQLGQHVHLQSQIDLTEIMPTQIVHLTGLTAPETIASGAALIQLQERRCVSTVQLVQSLAQRGMAPQLYLVTAGAIAHLGGEVMQAEQTPLWGLGRVLMNEHPDLHCKLIDVASDLTLEWATQALLNELVSASAEDEVLLTAQGRQVLRLYPRSLVPRLERATQPDVCLDFSSPGPLKHLYWRALLEQALQPDEIEIRPQAAGLNFRDVMYAMGLLSDEAVENGFAGASLGMELAGVVTGVGSAVTDFQIGAAVMGFAPACFSTRVITKTTAITHKPAAWTDEEAATVPTTFFTVYYALEQLAQLQAGERILIHGASGGVGLAAIQFARYKGAEIFATAGTDEKRDFVRLMGADHVLDSRSLRFAEEILQLTKGEGVDVILNSISGEAINRNLAILRPFGRFLELGKRDFYENSKLGLRPFRNNIAYFGIDADQLLIERPALAKRLFQAMMQLFEQGVLRPLPYRVFPASRIQEAFRYMQQSRQIGKVVVSFAEGAPVPSQTDALFKPLILQADASYLVTGGLSGFGLKTAQWLASKGAKTLVLLGRRGLDTPEAQPVVAALEADGIKVAVFACDVTDGAALEQVLMTVRQTLPPLKGIIHAAMSLDDAIIRNLDEERFQRVLAPKMLGAWHLHRLTQGGDLNFFAMYSSVTTYLGNPGQANYVAANMYLESLVHERRAQGLPAVYAAWGPIADAGYLVDNQSVKEALQTRLGGHALTTVQALQRLEQLLQSEQAGVAIVDWHWPTIQKFMPDAKAPKYSALSQGQSHEEGAHLDDIQILLEGLDAEAAAVLIADLLMHEVGQILRVPRERIALDKSVFDLGMDSLMGMELVLAIEERFGVRLPVMALTEGATIQRIAGKIVAHLKPDGSAALSTEQAQQQAVADVVRKHGSDLSAEQVAELAQHLALESNSSVVKP